MIFFINHVGRGFKKVVKISPILKYVNGDTKTLASPNQKAYNDLISKQKNMPTQTQQYTLQQFADLLSLETQLGIVDGGAVMQMMMKRGSGLPKEIRDVRGALRLALARAEDGLLEVTTYPTELSRESLLTGIGVR